ncbi:MAG TPA: enoyl-CoA hydratase-related protein [Candidatus Eremiobacteraceae bacterium]
MPETIVIERAEHVAHVRMNRPEVRNALDGRMIVELTNAFVAMAAEESIRVVVLEGAGTMFSGGADVKYMRASLELSQDENYRDALRLSDMFKAINDCPMPVIARVQAAALGGGSGLVAVCDIAIADDNAIFGFTEAKLGIVPAVISPFVIAKIGAGHARALFTTAERFDAARAHSIGLVQVVVPAASLDAAVQRTIDEVMACGPQAARVAKKIARTVSGLAPAEAREWTARTIAERRTSAEGQEGLRAFLDKRTPTWR